MPRVIQISGKKRHGKDTVAAILKDKLSGAQVLSFAEPMKQIMATTLGISVEELDQRKNSDNEYRVMLQRLGSDAIKPLFGESVWADLMKAKLSNMPDEQLVIISDWRFNCEVLDDSFKLRIHRPSVPVDWDNHASEVELDTYEGFTYTLENPEGAGELLKEVDKLVVEIKSFFKIVDEEATKEEEPQQEPAE